MSPAEHKAILEARLKLAYGVLAFAVDLCEEEHNKGGDARHAADELRRWQRNLVIRNGKVELLDEAHS